jgi:hypothetical protein
MVVSPGSIIAPVIGIAPRVWRCIHHLRLGHDDHRWFNDGRGLDDDGRRRVHDSRRWGNDHGCGGDDDRDREPQPERDMDPARVGRERQSQGGHPEATPNPQRP